MASGLLGAIPTVVCGWCNRSCSRHLTAPFQDSVWPRLRPRYAEPAKQKPGIYSYTSHARLDNNKLWFSRWSMVTNSNQWLGCATGIARHCYVRYCQLILALAPTSVGRTKTGLEGQRFLPTPFSNVPLFPLQYHTALPYATKFLHHRGWHVKGDFLDRCFFCLIPSY